MPNLNAVILPAKVGKDGKHKIRISVAHNGTTRYILTSISVNSETEFKKGVIVKRPDASYLNTKLRGILQHYQQIIDELGYVGGFTCAELISLIHTTDAQKHRTLLSVIEEYKQYARVKQSSISSYTTAWNNILNFFGGASLMESLTPSGVLALDASLRKRKVLPSSIRNYMIIFKFTINYAIKCGYVSYKIHPFASYKFPKNSVRESWLTVEQIKQIRDYKPRRRALARYCDLFMLSYYLGGINIADIRRIKFTDDSRELVYIRQKVENRTEKVQEIKFTIPDEAWELIGRLKDKDGYIKLEGGNTESSKMSGLVYSMRRLSKLLDIPNLVYYSARKSFSQHAFVLGVQESVIDYLLGHSPRNAANGVGYHYRYVTPEQANAALRLVLDNLK